MKKKISSVNEKILKFRKTNVWKAISGSLSYNLLKAFIIILLLVGLVFTIRPRNSYIYAQMDLTEDEFSYEASTININFSEPQDLVLEEFSEILIPLGEVAIMEEYYTSDGKLIISKNQEDSNASVSLIPSETCELLKMKTQNASTVDKNNILSNNISLFLTGSLTLRLYGCSACVRNADGTETVLDSERIQLQTSKSLTETERINNEIQKYLNEDGTVKEGCESSVSIQESLLSIWANSLPWTVYFNSADQQSTKKMKTHVSLLGDPYVLYSSDAHSVSCTGNGDIEMSYSPTANNYVAKLQELHLGSSKNQLNFEYDTDTNKVQINGFVDKATLSGYNLFPSFWNWYVSNIYMAPLTLISTVFAGVALMNAKNLNP